jgi:hypothetical protein
MDALVLLGSFFVLMMLGVPVAYALGMASLFGALWIDLPLDAVMIQIAAGVNKFSLLAIPFFVLAGAIMAEGGMARRRGGFVRSNPPCPPFFKWGNAATVPKNVQRAPGPGQQRSTHPR